MSEAERGEEAGADGDGQLLEARDIEEPSELCVFSGGG